MVIVRELTTVEGLLGTTALPRKTNIPFCHCEEERRGNRVQYRANMQNGYTKFAIAALRSQ
ncbi:hypothetical protein BH09BAC6_BH09BAC6_14760 [soil metagenome]|jgi:hypothetical protein